MLGMGGHNTGEGGCLVNTFVESERVEEGPEGVAER